MILEFSKLSIEEVIDSIDENKATEWQLDIRNFLKTYADQEALVTLSELQGEVIFYVDLKIKNIKHTAIALNEFLALKQGDTTILTESVRRKVGVIILAQAIEGKMDIHCNELTDEIKIPYTGQDQNSIHWGLNYVYLNENQVNNSQSVLHRIEKVAIASYGMKDETKAGISKNDDQSIFEVFSVKSYPVAVRKLGESEFTVIGDVEISRSINGHLLLNSPLFSKEIDTQKVVLLENDKSFRWLLKHEYLDDESNQIIDFDHIEEVLAPHIPSRFVVLNFPDAETGKDVVTLVVKRLYIDDFNFPTEGLKDYEIPRQNYSIGDFPETDDRAIIRDEVKRLLAQH
ncbi:MAG TPA: hypothetical protein VIG94_08975 [Faecalibacter sp.]